MLNQNIIVGRIADKPILVEEDGVKYTCLTLSVPRSYKNESGEYEVDFINVMLNDGIASTTVEYCHQGDLIGVKGRVQSRAIERDGKKEYSMEIIAEKITFLSSKKADE